MIDVSPPKDGITHPPFLALAGLIGLLHILFGVLCLYSNHQEWLQKETNLLVIFILIAGLARIQVILHIFSFKMYWATVSLLPTLLEISFAIFLFIDPSLSLSNISVTAAIFMLFCGLIRFIESYFMQAEGLKSFGFANGVALTAMSCMIFFKWPSAEMWTPWVIVAVDFFSVGLIALWFTYYAIYSLTRPPPVINE
jgi:uncharacterized membrane protein HdeD (DUF308 family)